MTPWKSPAALMAKANQALSSASVLLQLGDVDGACNRAYYAMFDAAQAALLSKNASDQDGLGKTHRGLINAFSAQLVKDGPVSKELGRQLKRAEELRIVADYNSASISKEDAANLIEQAHVFVAAMNAMFFNGPQPPKT